MGEVFIEGLGIVEIEGDMPNEAETQAILDAVGDSEDAGDPSITRQQEVGLQEPTIPELPEGPLGLISPETRAGVRRNIESGPGLLPLLAEMTPAAIGALAGGALGTPLGPPGIMGGAMLGGMAGELIAQETGVAPKSELNLALSGGGPIIGAAAGKAFQLGRRVVGTGITKAPFVRAAAARNIMSKAVSEFESLGTRIVGKQTGLMARTTDELFAAVRRVRIIIRPNALAKTRNAITDLQQELSPLAPFTEVRQAMKVLDNVRNTILAGAPTLDEVVRARSLIGAAIKQAESKGGVRFGSAKKVFAQLVDDMDEIAKNPSLTGRQTRLAKAAIARAKLDFSIKEFESGVARFVKDVPDAGGQSINIKGLQKWLRDITNPKHARFNKNLTSALQDELPDIKSRLEALAKVAEVGSPAGPGSIVVRGQTARIGRGAVGALFGAAAAGPVGAGVGSVLGASLPEMIVAILTTKTGAALLESAARLGKGSINLRTWLALGEILSRSAGERREAEQVGAQGP